MHSALIVAANRIALLKSININRCVKDWSQWLSAAPIWSRLATTLLYVNVAVWLQMTQVKNRSSVRDNCQKTLYHSQSVTLTTGWKPASLKMLHSLLHSSSSASITVCHFPLFLLPGYFIFNILFFFLFSICTLSLWPPNCSILPFFPIFSFLILCILVFSSEKELWFIFFFWRETFFHCCSYLSQTHKDTRSLSYYHHHVSLSVH